MQVIKLAELAQKQSHSTEEIVDRFEKEFSLGTSFCVVSPDKAEAICFELKEVQELISELSTGKISLNYLAEQLGLTSYQLHFVIECLLKKGQVNGELTYNTFTCNRTTKLLLLQEAKAHKHEHRRSMREKR